MQVKFNPSLTSLANQAEELISSTNVEVLGQEVRWYTPAVFNQVYGKMLVDDIVAMLQEKASMYDADKRYVSAQAMETAAEMIKNKFG